MLRIGRRVLISTARLLELFDLNSPAPVAQQGVCVVHTYDWAPVILAILQALDHELRRPCDATRSMSVRED